MSLFAASAFFGVWTFCCLLMPKRDTRTGLTKKYQQNVCLGIKWYWSELNSCLIADGILDGCFRISVASRPQEASLDLLSILAFYSVGIFLNPDA